MRRASSQRLYGGFGRNVRGADEHAAVLKPLTDSRQRTLNGFIHCIQRGIATGELVKQTDPAVIATLFDSFLLGVSTLARDGIHYRVLDDAVTALMKLWDAHAEVISPPHQNKDDL